MAIDLARLQQQLSAAQQLLAQYSAAGNTEQAQRTQQRIDELNANISTAQGAANGQTGGTVSPTLVSDVPPPAPSSDPNQDFLNSLKTKPVGDLTEEEIRRLQEIYSSSASSNLLDSYKSIIDASSGREAEYQKLLDETKAKQAADYEKRQAEIDAQLQALYAPQFSQIATQGERSRADLMRNKAFIGSGRSSRTEESRQQLFEQQNQLEAAKQAELSLDRELRLAKVRGDDAATIKGIQDSINEARKNTEDLKVKFAEAQAALQAELDTNANAQINKIMDGLLASKGFDVDLSTATGQIVDSNGRPILGQDGKPLEFVQQIPGVDTELSKLLGQLIDTNGQPILDPATGEPIVLPAKMNGFTKVDGTLLGIFDDGTAKVLFQGSNGAGGAGGSGAGTSDPNDNFFSALWSKVDSKLALDPTYSIFDAIEEAGYSAQQSQVIAQQAVDWLNQPAPAPTPEERAAAQQGGRPEPTLLEWLTGSLSLSSDVGLFS